MYAAGALAGTGRNCFVRSRTDSEVRARYPAGVRIDLNIYLAGDWLAHFGERIMTVISDYATKQTAYNARMETAIQGIGGDVRSLNDKITELQNSPGTVTPEDQALIDGLVTAGDALATRFEALDALTPPVAPG